MKLKGKKLVMFIFCIALFSGVIAYAAGNFAKTIYTTEIKELPKQKVINNVSLRDSIKKQLIDEINIYLKKQSPNAHPTIASSIVNHGLNYEIDICFIMGQTQIETNFGVAGVGKESSRRSLFGVIKKKYHSYDAAIEDYSKLLKKSYLVKGRTEQDLMKNYITGSGYRYASDKDYEVRLTRTYNKIKNSTKIYELQQQLKLVNS